METSTLLLRRPRSPDAADGARQPTTGHPVAASGPPSLSKAASKKKKLLIIHPS
jgi:hypothetical protein